MVINYQSTLDVGKVIVLEWRERIMFCNSFCVVLVVEDWYSPKLVVCQKIFQKYVDAYA